MKCDRRAVLAALGLSVMPGAPALSQAAPRTRLILLGTAGGPRPRKSRSGSAQAIVIGDQIFVIDCGYGVARQLVLAGLPLNRLRHILITHQHSDHNIDVGPLLQLAWLSGLSTSVDCWGPAPMRQMVEDYLRYQRFDIDLRIRDEGRLPFAGLIRSHDISSGGEVLRNETVRITAAEVPHPPMPLALAYRFDTADRSIVISGDTRESDAIVNLARGADVLVHEVMMEQRVREMLGGIPRADELARSVISHHTTAEQVGRVAARAGVKLLVLSHFVPAERPDISDEEWLAPVRLHFSGSVIVGRDLMEI